MEIPGPCGECGRPGVLRGCPVCGAQICAECRGTGRHQCFRPGGEPAEFPA